MRDNLVEILVGEVESSLQRYNQSYNGMTWREKVLLLVNVVGSIKKLGVNSNPLAARVGARERLRLYLVEHVNIKLTATELQVVSGISEYGRRIRELRVEDGYKILTGASNDPESGIILSPSEYLLISKEPDLEAARRWRIANRIRRETQGGSKAKLLAYLLENVGQIITSEELAYVAKSSEFGRRVRELRTEEGYAIATKFTGRPDLSMGEYVLENAERLSQPHERKITFAVQKQVYERANSSCQMCGWSRVKWKKNDPRILEIHHVLEHVCGGANTSENLIVLCNRCHDEIHAGRLELPEQLL